MIFKQLFDEESWTYTYILADLDSREAVFIDPVNTHVGEYLSFIKEYDLTLKYSLETHAHADHITAGGMLRQETGAKTAVATLCGAECADVQMNDGDEFTFGDELIKVLATPGHTLGSSSFLWRDRIFTGDTLLINGCGRTDFQGGDSGDLYESITQKLFTLPDETLVYPGHDYNGLWVSSIKQEKTMNPRLAGKSREEFIDIMDNLNLPKPRLIDEAVPANRACGLPSGDRHDAVPGQSTPVQQNDMTSEAKKHIREIDVAAAREQIAKGDVIVIDVREDDEYAAGNIKDAIHLPRGVLEFKIDQLDALSDKSKPVLLYCRSGNRSALAALTMQQLGYTDVVSMAGGFMAWEKDNGSEQAGATCG